ncbi:unnamed protein product [Spirodela intermedia]|uniref:TLC domain-containing protein n=1 Tax=Spirodela intermedia TaxID=51605 RepID=A0ABN7E7R3_SPIIN|nr:unnamed protein product [Spirodela intermedia]
MAIKSYSYEAEALVKEYLLAESFVPYISVLGGIAMCKMLTVIDGYRSLTKVQRIEWNNRLECRAHAIYITVMSLFLVFYSDLFSDDAPGGPTVFRSSPLSIFTLGVSVGYFITDLAMIFWSYPSLGAWNMFPTISFGLRHILRHSFREGQLYTFLCLISETTTRHVHRQGVVMFFSWVVARLLLFMFLFYHLYCHYEQVKQDGQLRVRDRVLRAVRAGVMNVVWFGKILRGLRRPRQESVRSLSLSLSLYR